MRLRIAIPLMDEWENLPHLLEDIRKQTFRDFEVHCCINQPDQWWQLPDKRQVCESNLRSLEYLSGYEHFPLKVIDHCTPGKGWKGKNFGVGWARKVLMDSCSNKAANDDIMLSLDGDTTFNERYFESVIDNFGHHIDAVALSVPYYHKLTSDPLADRSILHYEIYMRYYAINMWRIGSPYCFTALGSAMALPVRSYKAIGGMTPNKSGEDFYFLQKLRKYGELIYWNPEKAYPAARFSDRVFFGTGPAMIKGKSGDWSSYPIYSYHFFDEVKATYDLFPALFDQDIETPMDEFLRQIFNEAGIWSPIRKNHTKIKRFIRACHEKADGLRVLQYLKYRNSMETEVVIRDNPGKPHQGDEQNLVEFVSGFYGEEWLNSSLQGLSFSNSSIPQLDEIRNQLVKIEEKYQYDHYTGTHSRR
jgi:hypothetical protein